MSKIGRNDPCPCGSGKKYKRCCINKQTSSPRGVAGARIDPEDKTVVLFTDDALINHLRRDSPKIEASFDRLCLTDLSELSLLHSKTATLILAGLHHATQQDDKLRTTCGKLLINVLNNFTAAVQVLRSGYFLAPGVLARNVVETLAVIAHVFVNPEDLKICQAGEFPSTRAIASAKKIIPIFGQMYGFLSNDFAHIGELYHLFQLPQLYEAITPPLEVNLAFLRASIWLAYAVTELVFYHHVANPRYWNYQGQGAYMFDPSDEERAWLKQFLKQAVAENNAATPNSQLNPGVAPTSGTAPVS